MSYKPILMIALWLLSSVQLFAQPEQKQIRLLDEETESPIVAATFEYDHQKGLSDHQGVVRISYKKGTTLHLSHVNYGSWVLTDDEMYRIKGEAVFHKREITINLFPLTIIAVKSQNVQPDGAVKINYQDRLEHDAATILNQVPAFNSIRKGGNYGFDPVFRGFKYDQLNVVINGAQSATAACPNRMDPPTSQMAPNMMDHIEILKGPHALRYGNGFGATINFIPTLLRFSREPTVYGRASSGYQSNGNIQRGEGQVGMSGKEYDVSFFSSWSQGDDYSTGNGETVQSDFKRGSFSTNVGIRLTSNQQVRVSATYNRARDADFPTLPMDLREDDTWMFNARHDKHFERKNLKSWNTTIYGSFVNHIMNNALKQEVPRMANTQTSAHTYNYGGRTEGVWQLAWGKMYAGADLRIEGAEGKRVREFLLGPMTGKTKEDNAWQESRISKTGLFAEYQIKRQSFDYIASARMEMNTADVNNPTQEFTQANATTRTTQLNPGMSIGIIKNVGSKIQTGLWLARAQRSGSLTERFINYFPVGQDPYEMLGNPQLDPEVNTQADLTFKWVSKEKSSVHVDVFAAYLQDYISSRIDPARTPVISSSPGVRQFINISKAYKTGFELSWDQYLLEGVSHRMGIAYTYGKDLELSAPLPEIAPLDMRYALVGSYFKNRLTPEISFRYVVEQARISKEFGETNTPSFSTVDVKVGYQITHSFSIRAGVTNVLNENYYEHLNRSVLGTNNAIYAPGRNYFFNLNFSF